ncbi:FHA domain-containing protein [Mongoliibacter ruber]|uniref:FHA domain-containing protein n=1 Tax=Mongoliibacter ruber TaxID=1750599 RepID=A0A2T0WDL2_9BACT|nr:FHA domain-containing protein [Mongoliibacter ruber]PRY84781.1 FHA domain-containing protein [Mongoliibacter ruber]
MAKSTIHEGSFNPNEENPSKKHTKVEGYAGTVQSADDRTIVGFLISYSANEKGDFWALREGKNVIGSSNDCTIPLHSPTVSNIHAIINTRRSQNDNRLMVVITDQNSTNGVFVNNQDVEYQPRELKDRDKIKIGDFELLLLLVDKIALSLFTNEKLAQQQVKVPNEQQSFSSPYDFSVNPSKKLTKPE